MGAGEGCVAPALVWQLSGGRTVQKEGARKEERRPPVCSWGACWEGAAPLVAAVAQRAHPDSELNCVQVKGDLTCELCKAPVRNLPALPPRQPEAVDEAFLSGGSALGVVSPSH